MLYYQTVILIGEYGNHRITISNECVWQQRGTHALSLDSLILHLL
jgi:hypothetical protein